ncbi:hypothetical protein W911_11695 [Hyphomicrobium nitrativorans NL23]|uniref:Uncharacterized protein n=1 Tax=Hyphomicrobium nitrativorans NL23 TaxID=1029756 RepID=V5SJS7_9HYPH|nr:hypothetical protein [Hyphomicrobium nitrativorans]AHB50229.1 hypothetical protein W911_11695 [Hyphomicrobium nitrativorans NL23]
MQATHRFSFLSLAVLSVGMSLAWVSAAPAQPPSPSAPGSSAAVEEDLTLVVGTRFVSPETDGVSPKAQFTDARIALSAFNATDHCVDQRALELAMEYFNSLGPTLGRAGHYYFVPDAELAKAASMCERQHGQPPRAWVEAKTRVIAFGRIVPTADAPALERSIR